MAFLDAVNTITRNTIVPGMVDQVFKSGPTMAYIKRNCLAKYQGGPSWQENFLYGMMDVQAYNPGEDFDFIEQQIFTGGTVTPRYYNVPVPALLEKVKIEMAGPEAVFNYIDTIMQAAAHTMSAGATSLAHFRDEQVNAIIEALI